MTDRIVRGCPWSAGAGHIPVTGQEDRSARTGGWDRRWHWAVVDPAAPLTGPRRPDTFLCTPPAAMAPPAPKPHKTAAMKKATSFLRLTRPEFLLGGIVLYWMGTRAGGDLSAGRYLLGQALVTSIQLVAQYANEFFDIDADTAHDNRTWFSGGSGVLATGRLEPIVAWRAAMIAGLASIAVMIAAIPVDWRLTAVGAVALAGSWWYSAPPPRLVAGGYGELATAVIVGALVPLTGALAAGDIDRALLVSFAAPTTLVSLALLLAVHAPDASSDAAVGKKTLFVRLGGARSILVHRGVAAASVISIVGMAAWRPPWSTLLALPGALVLAVSAVLMAPHPHGMRARWLTVTAVAPVVLVALGFGLGTVV